MPTSSTNCLLFALKESIIVVRGKKLMVSARRIDTWWKVCNNGDFRSLLKNGKNLPLAQAMMIHSSRKGNAMINFIVVTLTVFYGLNLFKDNSCFFSSWGPPWKDNNYKSLQPFLMRLKIYLLSSCSHEFPDYNLLAGAYPKTSRFWPISSRLFFAWIAKITRLKIGLKPFCLWALQFDDFFFNIVKLTFFFNGNLCTSR